MSTWRRMGTSLQRLGLAVVAVTVLGLVAGWLFARGTPQRAADIVVSDFVTQEPARGGPPAGADPAPTSGTHDGEMHCGVHSSPVGVDDQLASLDAGIVAAQYDPGRIPPAEVEELAALAGREPGHTLLAPNPELEEPVVATSWGRRLALPEVNHELLSAFVTAYRGGRLTGEACEPGQ